MIKSILAKSIKIAVLLVLSVSTHAALAGEIRSYSQAEVDKLAAADKPILLDNAPRHPLLREGPHCCQRFAARSSDQSKVFLTLTVVCACTQARRT